MTEIKNVKMPSPEQLRENGRALRLAAQAGLEMNGWDAQYDHARTVSEALHPTTPGESEAHTSEALQTVFGGTVTETESLARSDARHQATRLPEVRAALAELRSGNQE